MTWEPLANEKREGEEVNGQALVKSDRAKEGRGKKGRETNGELRSFFLESRRRHYETQRVDLTKTLANLRESAAEFSGEAERKVNYPRWRERERERQRQR